MLQTIAELKLRLALLLLLSLTTLSTKLIGAGLGWKLLNIEGEPALNYHKETQLLVAAGTPSQLMLIDETLTQLDKGMSVPRSSEKASGPTKEKDK